MVKLVENNPARTENGVEFGSMRPVMNGSCQVDKKSEVQYESQAEEFSPTRQMGEEGKNTP